MNPFYSLFTAIQARIQSEVSQIRWIDMDLNQLETYQERPAVSWPCLLIDFSQVQYDNESELVQWGAYNISLRLGFPSFSNSNSLTPESVKEKALAYFEIENSINKALHGWIPTYEDGTPIAQPLIRMSAQTERRDDPLNIRVRQLIYSTVVEDHSTQPKIRRTNFSPAIKYKE